MTDASSQREPWSPAPWRATIGGMGMKCTIYRGNKPARNYMFGGFTVYAAGTATVCTGTHTDEKANNGAANARLIAAAPDLYAALDALLDGMEASGGWDGDEALYDAGIAAVRRARGEVL